ncbi:putative membrane protein [Methanosarcina vacuolata Z-761]|uniref:Putative membrane protein n=2 Tax=Methanosarcina vacuolata TaxID=2215 RepID=A0A0E3Q637_9EURY|nr:putative membrane protein [Methanosarcina vacuolata Z-761]
MKSHIGTKDIPLTVLRSIFQPQGVLVEELNVWGVNYMEQPADVTGQSIESEYEIGYEILQVPWWVVLLEGIIAILVGLFLLYRPAGTTVFLVQILGIFWLAEGILSVIGALIFSGNRVWKLLSGILSIIAGVVILTYPIYSPFIVLTLFVIFIGVWAIINGVVKIVLALKGGGWGIGIIGVLTIILGLLLLTNSLVGVLFLPWIFGFFLILGGIGSLIWGLKMRT